MNFLFLSSTRVPVFILLLLLWRFVISAQRKKDTLWEESKRLTNPQNVYVDLSDKLFRIKAELLEEMSFESSGIPEIKQYYLTSPASYKYYMLQLIGLQVLPFRTVTYIILYRRRGLFMHLSQLVNADHPLDEHAIPKNLVVCHFPFCADFQKKNASLLRKQPWPLQIYLYAANFWTYLIWYLPGIAPIVANRNCTIWRRLRNGQRWLPREPASTRWDLRWM